MHEASKTLNIKVTANLDSITLLGLQKKYISLYSSERVSSDFNMNFSETTYQQFYRVIGNFIRCLTFRWLRFPSRYFLKNQRIACASIGKMVGWVVVFVPSKFVFFSVKYFEKLPKNNEKAVHHTNWEYIWSMSGYKVFLLARIFQPFLRILFIFAKLYSASNSNWVMGDECVRHNNDRND